MTAVLAAGCRWISLREKDLAADRQCELARSLLPEVRRHGACLTLHGEAGFAKECGCDGVHLSAGSDAAAARHLLGATSLIGLSVHSAAEVVAIDGATVDYVVAGPAFETLSKPGYRPMGELAAIVRASPVPVIAIGGLDAARVPQVLAAGCAGVAVMGGVMRASDPGREVADLLAALARAQPRPR
jgi:thiamine-phosphate pyrophosphorylase